MVTVVLAMPSWVILVISGETLAGCCRAEFCCCAGAQRYPYRGVHPPAFLQAWGEGVSGNAATGKLLKTRRTVRH